MMGNKDVNAPEDAVCLRKLFFSNAREHWSLPCPSRVLVCRCERGQANVCVCGLCVGVLELTAPKDAVRQRTRCPMLESIGPRPFLRMIC